MTDQQLKQQLAAAMHIDQSQILIVSPNNDGTFNVILQNFQKFLNVTPQPIKKTTKRKTQ